MKFVIAWTLKPVSPTEAQEVTKGILEAYDAWTPPACVQTMLNKIDGTGGGIIAETDNPADLLAITAPFQAFLDYEVYPVVEVEAVIDAARANLK